MNFQLPTGQSRHQSLHGNLDQINIEIIRRPIWEMITEHPLDKLPPALDETTPTHNLTKMFASHLLFCSTGFNQQMNHEKGIQVNVSFYSLERFTAMCICI